MVASSIKSSNTMPGVTTRFTVFHHDATIEVMIDNKGV